MSLCYSGLSQLPRAGVFHDEGDERKKVQCNIDRKLQQNVQTATALVKLIKFFKGEKRTARSCS